MADKNQLIIQSLMGADPTMVHQAPNQVPNIIDAFKSFAQSGDYNPVHLPGTQPKDYLRELAHNPDILAKNIDQASNFNLAGAMKLKRTGAYFGKGITDYDAFKDAERSPIASVTAGYDPPGRNLHVHSIGSNLDSPHQPGSVPYKANYGGWSVGPSDLQDILKALVEEYPEAKTISGNRTSGARKGPVGNKDPDRNYIQRPIPGRE